MKLELFYPVKPTIINQGWGENKDYYAKHIPSLKNGHNGIDFFAQDGQPIHAAHNGLVVFTGQDGSGGETCVIRTDTKREYEGKEVYFKTIYCHLKKGSYRVKAGQNVRVGDVIALADNTGLSTGSHLHFGFKPVYKGEKDWEWLNLKQDNGFNGAINPTPYWSGMAASDYRSIFDRASSILKVLENLLQSLKGRNQ